MAGVAEGVGIERGVAVAVEALQGDDAEARHGPHVQRIDGGHVAVGVEGRLAAEGDEVMSKTVVDAGVEEVGAVGVVAAVERLAVGLQ